MADFCERQGCSAPVLTVLILSGLLLPLSSVFSLLSTSYSQPSDSGHVFQTSSHCYACCLPCQPFLRSIIQDWTCLCTEALLILNTVRGPARCLVGNSSVNVSMQCFLFAQENDPCSAFQPSQPSGFVFLWFFFCRLLSVHHMHELYLCSLLLPKLKCYAYYN